MNWQAPSRQGSGGRNQPFTFKKKPASHFKDENQPVTLFLEAGRAGLSTGLVPADGAAGSGTVADALRARRAHAQVPAGQDDDGARLGETDRAGLQQSGENAAECPDGKRLFYLFDDGICNPD